MSWNGLSGNNGLGFNATEQDRIAAVQKKNKEREPLSQPKYCSLQQQVEEYALTLSNQDAEETIQFCLSCAKNGGYLPRLLEWVQERGFHTTQDVRVQAAALEYGKGFFSM